MPKPNSQTLKSTTPKSLTQLLETGRAWRGWKNTRTSKNGIDTGYPALNEQLHQGGWPQTGMIEVFSQQTDHVNWLLLGPAVSDLLQPHRSHYVALINPPHMPLPTGLLQKGLNLNQLLVVDAPEKRDALYCFQEFTQNLSCVAVFMWPLKPFSYTELRKCQLASHTHKGLHVFFKPQKNRQDNSPSTLKLQANLTRNTLKLVILKQRGALAGIDNPPIHIPLSGIYETHSAHRNFLEFTAAHHSQQILAPYQPSANHRLAHIGSQKAKKKLVRGL